MSVLVIWLMHILIHPLCSCVRVSLYGSEPVRASLTLPGPLALPPTPPANHHQSLIPSHAASSFGMAFPFFTLLWFVCLVPLASLFPALPLLLSPLTSRPIDSLLTSLAQIANACVRFRSLSHQTSTSTRLSFLSIPLPVDIVNIDLLLLFASTAVSFYSLLLLLSGVYCLLYVCGPSLPPSMLKKLLGTFRKMGLLGRAHEAPCPR